MLSLPMKREEDTEAIKIYMESYKLGNDYPSEFAFLEYALENML